MSLASPTVAQGHGTSIGLASMAIVADDMSTLRRLVGFGEYRLALELLDEFTRRASPLQWEAADQIVQSREEFMVYVELARFFEPSPRDEAQRFRRHGLAWLTALARVEVQSMLAAFTNQPDPFSLIAPNERDGEAYDSLILDGLKTHVRSLAEDPVLIQELQANAISSRTLALLRRMGIAQGFHRAVGQRWDVRFSPDEKTQWKRWGEQLRAAREPLIEKVQLTVQASAAQARKNQSQVQEILRKCQGRCAGFR